MNNLKHDFRKTAGSDATRHERLKNIYDLCVRKTRTNIQRLADEPKSAAWAADGDYFKFKEGFYEIGNWTSSFFTGMALLAWRSTEDEFFLKQSLAPCAILPCKSVHALHGHPSRSRISSIRFTPWHFTN